LQNNKTNLLNQNNHILIIIFLWVFLASGVSFGSDDFSIDAIQYRIKGYVYQQQGDYDQAAENYKNAIVRNPFYVCAYNDLGIVYEQQGWYDRAQEQYIKAIELDPTYVSAYSNLALLNERLGDLDAACYYWGRRANIGNPEDPWTVSAKEKYKKISEILKKEGKLVVPPTAKFKNVKPVGKTDQSEAAVLAKKLAREKSEKKRLVKKQRKAEEIRPSQKEKEQVNPKKTEIRKQPEKNAQESAAGYHEEAKEQKAVNKP